jgi:amidase
LCFTKGVATMGATKALMGHVPDFDCTVVQKLNAAGAVILGKLNLTEGAMAGYNPEFQVPVNPWGANLWSGASSSGSGVATSAGLCYGSLGSDTGGSIRFPSAACGIVGIKPTWGRVSRYGVLALAESLDHIGPMTRSAADAGIILQAIAGLDPKDPTSLHAPVPDMLGEIDKGVQGLRIGMDEEYISGNTDPQVVESVFAGIKVLEGLGAVIVPIQMPATSGYLEAWSVLCAAEAVAAHEATYPSRRDDYGPWFQAWLDTGAAVTGAGYAQANNVRLACRGLLNNVFENIDVIGCPTMTTPPFPISLEDMYGATFLQGLPDWGRFTVPFDFSGAPTISLPCGQTDDGLPLSIQFVGKHLSEPLLCRIGNTFEQNTQWHDLRPDIG